MFVGELSLTGEIRPVRGIINIIEAAKAHGFSEIYIPVGNATQAALVANDIDIYPVQNLRELWLKLKSLSAFSPLKPFVENTQKDKHKHIILDDVCGQEQAKRALTIAVAGRHNILLQGPPGTGKSMLAKCIPSLLPTMSLSECIDVTKLHSLVRQTTQAITERPFRAPHHSASLSAMIGGGSQSQPGEISLAHHGVLFLDEFAEYPRNVLEALRQPLEDHQIAVSRANIKTTYPANFMLVATANPCPCGYYQSPDHTCNCSPQQLQAYQKKLSGPLLDRIDIAFTVNRPTESVLFKSTTISSPEQDSAKFQIRTALNNQINRYHNPAIFNSSLSSHETATLIQLTKSAKNLLESATKSQNFSARAFFKIIKVARTIADLESSDQVDEIHIAEAIAYRIR
ncbi:YifB family Mg chelatase-like AAA ATPase [Candidatus Saccharibacteria bacterium]|nr:YifB family Mg chelatase-like AAA ATPase [Candidatus Saccharibacteria bacterium]